MSNNILDLRMGVDVKLTDENISKLDVGALSYSVDKQNLYIDALKEDKISIERQMLNADKAYAIRDKSERIVAQSGYGDYSFSIGQKQPESIVKVKLSLKEGFSNATYSYDIIEGNLDFNYNYYLEYPAYESDGKVTYYKVEFDRTLNSIFIPNFPTQYYTPNNNFIYNLIKGQYGSIGKYSFSGGSYNLAEQENSFAMGLGLVSNNKNQTTVGQYNLFNKWETARINPDEFIMGTEEVIIPNAVDKYTEVIYAYNDYDLTPDGKILPKEKISATMFLQDEDVSYLNVLLGKIVAYENSPDIVTEPLDNVSVYTSFKRGSYTYDKYQIPTEYLFVVGNGKDDSNRSNVLTVNTFGDVNIQKNLYVSNAINSYSIDSTIAEFDELSITDKVTSDVTFEGKIISNSFETNNAEVKNLNVTNNAEVENLNVTNNTEVKNLNVINSAEVKNLNATNNITINNDNVITQTMLNNTKTEIMEDVQAIADSIITDVWYRGSQPPQTVKQAKLLWIRYDANDEATYGKGVLYYFNPTLLLSENLTDAQVANEANWIPMSAIYT